MNVPAGGHQADVVVVGAGPAGIIAATEAASGGRNVWLLERKAEIGLPVRCGEGIGLKGFSLGIKLRRNWILTTIHNAELVSPSGLRVRIPNIPLSYIIDRHVMESELADEAVALGVKLVLKCPVNAVWRDSDGLYWCETPRGRWAAPCLVLADGVESRLARDLGWHTALELNDIESCAFARVNHCSVDPETIVLYTGRQVAPAGYAWVFPRNPTSANVGLGILGSYSTAGRAKELLGAFILRHFPGAEISHFHCGGAPVGRWVRPLVRGGCMIVGDAARQVNAVSGAGIAYALIAGTAAGRAAAAAWRSGSFDQRLLYSYHKAWASHYGKQQDRSYALKRMVITYDDAFLDRIARTLLKKQGKTLTYLSLFLSAFSRHPILMFKAYKLFR